MNSSLAYQYMKRLEGAINSLNYLVKSYEDEANSGHPDSRDAIREQIRLRGKIEGVKLALSYFDEMTRE